MQHQPVLPEGKRGVGNEATAGFYLDRALGFVADKLIFARIKDVTHWFISEVQVFCGSGMFWSGCLGFGMIVFMTGSQRVLAAASAGRWLSGVMQKEQ